MIPEDQRNEIQDLLTKAKRKVQALPKTRETALVITKIDEAVLWLTVTILAEVAEPIPPNDPWPSRG